MGKSGDERDSGPKNRSSMVEKSKNESTRLTPQNILGNLTKRFSSLFIKKEKDTLQNEGEKLKPHPSTLSKKQETTASNEPLANFIDNLVKDLEKEKAAPTTRKSLPPTPTDLADLQNILDNLDGKKPKEPPAAVKAVATTTTRTPKPLPSMPIRETADDIINNIMKDLEKEKAAPATTTRTPKPLPPTPKSNLSAEDKTDLNNLLAEIDKLTEPSTSKSRPASVEIINIADKTVSPNEPSQRHSTVLRANQPAVSVDIKFADDVKQTLSGVEKQGVTDNKALPSPPAARMLLTPPQQKTLNEATVILNKDGMKSKPSDPTKPSGPSSGVGTPPVRDKGNSHS